MTSSGDPRRNGDTKSRSAKAPKPSGDMASRQEAADYVASMLNSVRLLAQRQGMPFLSYLIGIALEEANNEKTRRD